MNRLRNLLLSIAFQFDFQFGAMYWCLSRLPLNRFGRLKGQAKRFRVKISAEEVRAIIEDKQIRVALKRNILCDDFSESNLTDDEIDYLVNLGSTKDGGLRDKAISLMIDYARRDRLPLPYLLNKLKLSIDEYQCKVIMMVFSHLSTMRPLTQIDKELASIALQRLSAILDPYSISCIPTAIELLTTLVADNRSLLPLVFEAYESSKDVFNREQYIPILRAIALRNRVFARPIANWMIANRISLPDLRKLLQGLELTNDPRALSTSAAKSKTPLLVALGLFVGSCICLLAVWGRDKLDFVSLTTIQFPRVPSNSQHTSEMLDLVLRDNVFLVGLVVTISIFAMREIYLRFGSDLLITFLMNKIRLIILALLFASFLSTGWCLAIQYQESAIPPFPLQFSILSLYLNPLLFILWCASLISSLRPRVALKQYLVARKRIIRLLSHAEATLSLKLVKLKDLLPHLNFAFEGVTPNPGRNQFTISSDRSGIITDVNVIRLRKIHDLIVHSNESFDKYGKPFALSELQLDKRVGVAVDSRELLATFYSDDIRIIHRLEPHLGSLFQIGLGKEYTIFKDLIDTLFSALDKAIEARDVSMHGFVLLLLSSLLLKIAARKSRRLKSNSKKGDGPAEFSLDAANEATFMEVYVFKAAARHARRILTSENSAFGDQFSDFAKEVIRVSQVCQLYTSSGFILHSFNEAQDSLIESKQFKDLRLAFIQKAQFASICYANENTSNDAFLRLDFQEALSKVLSIIDEEPAIKKHLDNYFTSYESFVCYMMVVRYFNAERVSRCLKWIHQLIDEHKSQRGITFFGMRTIYVIGALSLVRERFALASEGAEHLIEIETLTGVKIESIANSLSRNKYSIGVRNTLWGGLFNPNTITSDITNYLGFVNLFVP